MAVPRLSDRQKGDGILLSCFLTLTRVEEEDIPVFLTVKPDPSRVPRERLGAATILKRAWEDYARGASEEAQADRYRQRLLETSASIFTSFCPMGLLSVSCELASDAEKNLYSGRCRFCWTLTDVSKF